MDELDNIEEEIEQMQDRMLVERTRHLKTRRVRFDTDMVFTDIGMFDFGTPEKDEIEIIEKPKKQPKTIAKPLF